MRREGRRTAPGSVSESVRTGSIADRTEAERSTVGFLASRYAELHREAPDGPACGGPLLVHGDGSFQCTAGCPGGTAVVHVPEALHYCDAAGRLGITADELGHVCPQCTAVGVTAQQASGGCVGVELDHRDGGESTCTLGAGCSGGFHASGRSCGLFEPCQLCGITQAVTG